MLAAARRFCCASAAFLRCLRYADAAVDAAYAAAAAGAQRDGALCGRCGAAAVDVARHDAAARCLLPLSPFAAFAAVSLLLPPYAPLLPPTLPLPLRCRRFHAAAAKIFQRSARCVDVAAPLLLAMLMLCAMLRGDACCC